MNEHKVHFELTTEQRAIVRPLIDALNGRNGLLAQVHYRWDGAYVVRVRVIPDWKVVLIAMIIRGLNFFNLKKGMSDNRMDFQQKELGYLPFSEE